MDNKIEIILQCDDNGIDKNKVVQIAFSAIADIPCPAGVKSVNDLNFKQIEDILKDDYDLKMVKLNNVRIISKTVAELEKD